MKVALVGGYIVALAVGAIVIGVRARQPVEYTASRRLEKHHRLQEADLRLAHWRWALATGLPSLSDYAGRYLDRAVESGTTLKREYLADRPSVVAADSTVAYSWYLNDTEREWSRVLDVGWLVDLCADTCPVMGAPVLAIDCRSPGGADCAAILQLTPNQLKAIGAYPGKQKLRVAVSEARRMR